MWSRTYEDDESNGPYETVLHVNEHIYSIAAFFLKKNTTSRDFTILIPHT
jgi:hypothetical protein